MVVVSIGAADWPQWQGPDRTRVPRETGLLQECMAVAGNRLYVQGARDGGSLVSAIGSCGSGDISNEL
jgi:hypothetical protein